MIKKTLCCFGAIILLFLVGCQSGESRKDILLGKWAVKWTIEKAENFDPSMALHMNGSAYFLADGQANLTAYGFEGCIFGNDTIKNELTWTLDENSISLINKVENFELRYKITELTKNRIRLHLLDDISLELSRQYSL